MFLLSKVVMKGGQVESHSNVPIGEGFHTNKGSQRNTIHWLPLTIENRDLEISWR